MTTSLGIILGSERRAKALLSKVPLKNILFLSKHELHEAGLPYSTATRLESAVSLVKEAMAITAPKPSPLISSKLVYDYIKPLVGFPREENFWILCLDIRQQPLSFSKIGYGGIGETTISIRRIVRTAFSANASRIILVHNHPSGGISPSDTDIQLTESITKSLAPIDINVIDHLILGQGSYYSFADNGGI
jgi:DNA repair protein RadC